MNATQFYPVNQPDKIVLRHTLGVIKVSSVSPEESLDIDATISSLEQAGFSLKDISPRLADDSSLSFEIRGEEISIPKPTAQLKRITYMLKERQGIIVHGQIAAKRSSVSRIDFYPGSVSVTPR